MEGEGETADCQYGDEGWPSGFGIARLARRSKGVVHWSYPVDDWCASPQSDRPFVESLAESATGYPMLMAVIVFVRTIGLILLRGTERLRLRIWRCVNC
jgi:hypothetical protein